MDICAATGRMREDFPPLNVHGESLRLISVCADKFGKRPLFAVPEITDPPKELESFSNLKADEHYYQLYFMVEREGKWAGDIAIELVPGAKKAHVSGWSHIWQDVFPHGVDLGMMALPAKGEGRVLDALARHLSERRASKTLSVAFDLGGTPNRVLTEERALESTKPQKQRE